MCRAFVGFDLLYFTRLCSDILGVMENTTVVVLIYCLAQQRKNFESRPTFAKVTPKVKVACFFDSQCMMMMILVQSDSSVAVEPGLDTY